VSITNRMQAARLILADILTLYNELAICKGFSPEMLELAAGVKQSADKRELYRRVLGHVKNRLVATIKWCETELLTAGTAESAADLSYSLGGRRREYLQAAAPSGAAGEVDVIKPIFDAAELTSILTTMHSSLVHGGYADVADGYLVDLIRRVATFGLTLVPLDLRQESTRHMMAVDAITQYLGTSKRETRTLAMTCTQPNAPLTHRSTSSYSQLHSGIGSYMSWDEPTRVKWLKEELDGKRPLIRTSDIGMCLPPSLHPVLPCLSSLSPTPCAAHCKGASPIHHILTPALNRI
jgi:phosphoenolpyruvate carboxylase